MPLAVLGLRRLAPLDSAQPGWGRRDWVQPVEEIPVLAVAQLVLGTAHSVRPLGAGVPLRLILLQQVLLH
jgi:hypothetical protein